MGISKISKETLQKAYKPFDIVTTKNGDVGFISETSVNENQDSFEHQICYSVTWLVGNENKAAWYRHDELKRHCNFFIKIADALYDSLSPNRSWIKRLFNNYDEK